MCFSLRAKITVEMKNELYRREFGKQFVTIHHRAYIIALDTDKFELYISINEQRKKQRHQTLINGFMGLFLFSEAEELSSRLMHTIIDIRNDESGRVVLEEAKREKISNPFDLQCIYFEELLSKC